MLEGRRKAALAPLRPKKQVTWINQCAVLEVWSVSADWQSSVNLSSQGTWSGPGWPWSSSSVSLTDVKDFPCYPLHPRCCATSRIQSCILSFGEEGCNGAVSTEEKTRCLWQCWSISNILANNKCCFKENPALVLFIFASRLNFSCFTCFCLGFVRNSSYSSELFTSTAIKGPCRRHVLQLPPHPSTGWGWKLLPGCTGKERSSSYVSSSVGHSCPSFCSHLKGPSTGGEIFSSWFLPRGFASMCVLVA